MSTTDVERRGCIVLQHSTQHAGERQVEEGAFWHLGRRLSGMQGHELAGTCLAHPHRRRRYNIAIMPTRNSWKDTSVEASTASRFQGETRKRVEPSSFGPMTTIDGVVLIDSAALIY